MQSLLPLAKGVEAALPIILGYVPIGMAYGLLAQQTGLKIWATLALSLFVFAGASQFMAVSMIFRGISAPVIVGTAFIVNFRHLLMSAAITPSLTHWKKWQRLLLGATITDEAFAAQSLRFAQGERDAASALSLNISAYVAWALSGLCGYYLGSLIATPEAWGLDFALPAMFIGLLLPLCTHNAAAIAAICGGATSILLYRLGLGPWAPFAGALVGATAGCLTSFAKESA